MAFDLATKRAEKRKPNFEKLLKALAVMNHLGYFIYGADGHTWIGQDENYPNIFRAVQLNNKIYGGVAEAVDTFDAAYQMDGNPPLADEFESFGLHMGNGGVGEDRIYPCKKGNGGLV